MRASVVVPTTSHLRIKFLLRSLKTQNVKPYEVVVIAKDTEIKVIENSCGFLSLNCIVIEQKSGYFTKALNMAKNAASGEVVLFTDDDAIALEGWIGRYLKLFRTYKDNIGSISSRDLYIDMKEGRLLSTVDDRVYIKIFRILTKYISDGPLDILKKYWCGVYLDRNFNIRHGPCIPDRRCYSLPFRGVNMAFRGEALEEVRFPEHPLLKRAPGNEQYVGLQLILNGWESIYIPNNPILHMARQDSLSRGQRNEISKEVHIMRSLYKELLARNR